MVEKFTDLTAANRRRQEFWNKDQGSNGPLYAATELAGEIGEICNVIKKLEREKRGLAGSRATLEDLREEIGDGIICLFLLADEYGIDAMAEAARKFNKTSRKLGFPVEMEEAND